MNQAIDLIGQHNLTESFFIYWQNRSPQIQEVKLLDALLVSVIEHGPQAPSIALPQTVTSTGNPLNVALATSALTVGTKHGGAIGPAMQTLSRPDSPTDIVQQAIAQNQRLPGFGHKVYTDTDPRSEKIYSVAKDLNFSCQYFDRAYQIEGLLAQAKNKKLVFNVDGAIAAGLLELGFSPDYGMAFFIIPRLIGAAYYSVQEQSNKSYRR